MATRSVLVISLICTVAQLAFAEVPTGCVVLINAHASNYLNRAELVNQQLRRVVAGIDPSQVWTIIKRDHQYRIKVRGCVNELFASTGQQSDPERRNLYVWEPAREEAKGGAWDIKELSGGKYSIRSVEFDEFLFFSTVTRNFQTYTPKSIAPKDDPKFQWYILPC
uniref:Putative conserved secreted protein n=1 Tax=Culex tarsalis TaxID=7177 RepID=A0A1Q3EUR1_CULTA